MGRYFKILLNEITKRKVIFVVLNANIDYASTFIQNIRGNNTQILYCLSHKKIWFRSDGNFLNFFSGILY